MLGNHTYFKLEAFDLADKGYALPFFRRMMTILDKVLKKRGDNV
jgi:hypothetical protein